MGSQCMVREILYRIKINRIKLHRTYDAALFKPALFINSSTVYSDWQPLSCVPGQKISFSPAILKSV